MKTFLISTMLLVSTASMASDLSMWIVGEPYPSSVTGRITIASISPGGALIVKSSKTGLSCSIDKDVAQKSGLDLVALAGQISQNLVDVTCGVIPATSNAKIVSLEYKIKAE